MFKGLRWYDWLIGLMTYGLWIVYKVLRNMGFSFLKILAVTVLLLILLLSVGSYLHSNKKAGMVAQLDNALQDRDVLKAEQVLNEYPDTLSSSGKTASEVITEITKITVEKELLEAKEREASIQLENERLERERIKNLEIAKENGFGSYEEYLSDLEIKKSREAELLKSQLRTQALRSPFMDFVTSINSQYKNANPINRPSQNKELKERYSSYIRSTFPNGIYQWDMKVDFIGYSRVTEQSAIYIDSVLLNLGTGFLDDKISVKVENYSDLTNFIKQQNIKTGDKVRVSGLLSRSIYFDGEIRKLYEPIIFMRVSDISLAR